MLKNKFLIILTMLILVSMACRFNIDLPIPRDVKTGPTVTEPISVPNLANPNDIANIILGFGAGELNLSTGTKNALIDGTATYNVEDFKPKITIDGSDIKIQTGSIELEGIPDFDERIKKIWDLNLGTRLLDLTIRAGAYRGNFELGNLSLNNLHITDGASEVNLNFAGPNLTEMQTLHYETGASNIELHNLANANFSTMIFESGAGNYVLDFQGQLKRNSSVFIETGLSSITISVPEGMNTRLSLEGGLTNITAHGAWEQSGSQFIMTGDGPLLAITIEMNAGNLILNSP